MLFKYETKAVLLLQYHSKWITIS